MRGKRRQFPFPPRFIKPRHWRPPPPPQKSNIAACSQQRGICSSILYSIKSTLKTHNQEKENRFSSLVYSCCCCCCCWSSSLSLSSSLSSWFHSMLASRFVYQPSPFNLNFMTHSLAHVVNGQGRHGCTRESFHFHPCRIHRISFIVSNCLFVVVVIVIVFMFVLIPKPASNVGLSVQWRELSEEDEPTGG